MSSRRVNVALGLVAAVVVGIVLVAPVVFRDSGGNGCAKTLAFEGRTYTARKLSGFVQSIAIGTGVASGCGTQVANVDVRSVVGVPPARAVALPTDNSSIYVRKGLCPRGALLACLRR